MIYKSLYGDVDVANLVRLYPAVVVSMYGDEAEMSLEWCELYGEKVEIVKYILVFDRSQRGSDTKDKTVFEFANRTELEAEMQSVSDFFELLR